MKFTRKKKIAIGLLVLSVYAIPLLTIDGALFLKSQNDEGGLKGESTNPDYEGWIEIDSFQFGGGVGVTLGLGGQRESSAPSLSEVTISKTADSTSTGFFSSMTLGTVLPEMRLFVPTNANPGRIIKIYLRDVIISSVSWSSGGEFPSESVSLNFAAFKVEHYFTDSEGKENLTGSASYNRLTGKASY
jgi:type VI secretion system secreted protein Hcp